MSKHTQYTTGFQSTHPMKDETYRLATVKKQMMQFQSTHPMKDETKITFHNVTVLQFQSTHPMKDETCPSSTFDNRFYFNPLIQ